jgi:hypothetical protein
MSRRSVPGMFCVGMVLCSVLIATRLWASWPPNRVPDLRGHWDGFFLAADNGGVRGLVGSDITGQLHREIKGEGLLALEDQTPLEFYIFKATVAADNVIAGTGRSTTGRVVVRGGLQTFAGVQGDAGIWDPDLRFVPARGRPLPVGATLLHPFPDDNAPNLGGYAADGSFQGLTDPTFRGAGTMSFGTPDRGGVPGSFAFIPTNADLHPAFSWPIRATTSGNRQFVMIGQGKTGRMSYIGSVITRNGSPSEVWGIARLSLLDGQVLYNAINFNLRVLNP